MKRRVRVVAADGEANGGASEPAIVLKPGARLVRDWGGRTHTVLVLEDGYDYEGETDTSLTRITSRITGAHWCGPASSGCAERDRSSGE